MSSRILVVDDDGPQRRSLRLALSIAGFETIDARTGREALELLDRRAFDLVVADVMMPELSGVELVRRMRVAHPQTPVVLISGYHISERQLERIGPNAIAFVPKPFEVNHLCALLKRKLAAPAEDDLSLRA